MDNISGYSFTKVDNPPELFNIEPAQFQFDNYNTDDGGALGAANARAVTQGVKINPKNWDKMIEESPAGVVEDRTTGIERTPEQKISDDLLTNIYTDEYWKKAMGEGVDPEVEKDIRSSVDKYKQTINYLLQREFERNKPAGLKSTISPDEGSK